MVFRSNGLYIKSLGEFRFGACLFFAVPPLCQVDIDFISRKWIITKRFCNRRFLRICSVKEF